MATSKDYLRAEITQQLAPALAAAGFTRHQPKTFLRRHGDLVHVLAFSGSWSGGATFTLTHSVTLLCDPFADLHGLRVGHAHQRGAEEPYVPWAGPTPETAQAAIASASKVVHEVALPWLARVRDLPGFVLAYVANPNNGLDDFSLAVALARAGEEHRPWWSCERLSPQVPDGSDHEKSRRERALELQSALASGRAQALLDHWRDERIATLKLGLLPDQDAAGTATLSPASA